MKTTLKVLAFLLALSAAAGAQVVPAATDAGALPASGRLYYALRYGQTAGFGSGLSSWQTSNLSGNASYANARVRAPFSAQYAGGYTWTLTGPSYESGLFQRMYLSQGGVWRKWVVSVSDDVSYLPQSPFTGFSGIPGIGEPIGTPNPTPVGSQSILTLNTHVVENAATGSIENKATGATVLSGTGTYDLMRFPNNDGLNTDTYTANGRITHRLDGRDAIIGTYRYSLYSYPDYTFTFETQAGLIGFHRLLSRKLTAAFAAGPMWINSSNQLAVPSTLTYTVNGSVEYTSKPTTVEVVYSHGTNGGAGYLLGATLDSLNGNVSRNFGPNLLIGWTGGYSRTSGLINNGVTNSVVGGTQATWQINRNFIAYANYTGISQGSTSLLPTNAVNQTLQTIGFGVGYSPRTTHLKQ
jgi:hypothetical protein